MPNRHTAALMRVNRLAWLLDNSIPLPGTRFRIGIDGLLGLLPVGGDALAAFFSAYILVEAMRLGAGPVTLLKMAGNILMELAVGVIPVVGDFFDFAWKANLKNARLLAGHLERFPAGTRSLSRVGTALGLALLAGAAMVVLVAGAIVFWAIWTVVQG